jgi:hypothetical protein
MVCSVIEIKNGVRMKVEKSYATEVVSVLRKNSNLNRYRHQDKDVTGMVLQDK